MIHYDELPSSTIFESPAQVHQEYMVDRRTISSNGEISEEVKETASLKLQGNDVVARNADRYIFYIYVYV